MPELSPDARGAMRYWSVIESAARLRATTADLWAAINDAAAEQGLSSPGVSLRGVNELRSYAAQQQNAADYLERSDRSAPIEAGHIGPAPWAREGAEYASVERWQITYLHTTLDNGVERTDWRTSMFTGTMPGTVGDLMDQLDLDAETLADEYELEHVGVSSVTILRV